MVDKTNVFKKFIGSISNVRAVPKYIKEGLGRAVFYAFLLMLVVGLVKGISLGFSFNKYIDEVINTVNDNKYEFKIDNGILEIESEPIIIDEGSTLIYIDDKTDISKSSELNNITVHSDEYILVLKDGVIVSSNDVGNQTVYYKDFLGNEAFTKEHMTTILSMVGKISMVVIIVFGLFESIVIYIMNSLLIAGVSMLTNIMMKLGLKFSEMFSLALYAGTLPALLQLALSIIFPSIYFSYAAIMGTLVFILIVLRTMRKDIDEGMHIQ